jgi:hypothetical protein
MITLRNVVTSAVATLGLFVFGTVNSANAGHPGSGREMGHGPVVNSSGKIGKEPGKFDKNKFDKERKEWEYKYWSRYDYCFPTCSYPVETYAPVYEVPVAAQPVVEVPVVVPTCYEYPCSYEFHRSFHDRPLDSKKPTTASSLRNTENLGSMASHTSGRGRK